MTADRWIEWECPQTGVDFDEFRLVGPDAMIPCPDCGGEHRAGSVGHVLEQTAGGVIQLTEEQWRHTTGTVNMGDAAKRPTLTASD